MKRRNNQDVLPSLAISVDDLRDAFMSKTDGYEVELLHVTLSHILRHGILIYQSDLKHLEECNLSSRKIIWQATKDIHDHLVRLGILCDLARELLFRVPDIVSDRMLDETAEKLSLTNGTAKPKSSIEMSVPKIFSKKFGETQIAGLNEIDIALDDIFDSLLIVYSDLLPKLANPAQITPEEVEEIVDELIRHFDHIVGHCEADLDAFCKLLPLLEGNE